MKCVANRQRWHVLALALLAASGCAAPKVDFSQIKQPDRSAKLDAYDVFVGSWTWEADLANVEGETGKKWKGTAEWRWTLDKRCLHGSITAESGKTKYETAGIWSWHPTKKRYMWWMFNNWGFPQEGTATYDEDGKCWCMPYTSVGLDGTTSHGCYVMKVKDHDTLDWCMTEWADSLHTVKKMEMTGTYKRKK
ncbi:MAG: hypothetical protein HY763_00650 [Planctomycetes bacterium]|nr:hypothetical protein [Planctomycetota bacterium]